MKSQKLFSVLFVIVLAAMTLLGASNAVIAQDTGTATPAVDMTFDMKPILEKFYAELPEGFFGIKPVDALAAIGKDAKTFILDVREPAELTKNGFLKGAVNIPIRDLFNNLDKLPADKAAPMIVYCGVGHRGGMAVLGLRMLGYTGAKSILGGLTAWKAANLPLEAADGKPVEPVAGTAAEVDPDIHAAIKAFFAQMPDSYYATAPADALKALSADPKPFLLDVRAPAELEANGWIKDSVNIPFPTLLKNLDKLPADKATPMIVYCAIGHRGGMAMMTLRLLGYTNVMSIGGGFNNWVKAGLPIEKMEATATAEATVAK